VLPDNSFTSVAEWLTLKQSEVLDRFHSLPSAYSDGYDQKRFVYIPGTRKDRVLIVAHSDTVWGDTDIELNIDETKKTIESKNKYKPTTYTKNGSQVSRSGVGINADDRAGCAIAWQLRDLGHSILITSGEESGCVAAKWLINDDYWKEEFNNNHNFAVEFDRKNEKDIVFYDIATKKFAEYVTKETGYKPEYGTGTDIKHICKLICGVNLSVGYKDEHYANETLYVEQWLNTLKVAHKWLIKQDLEKYPYERLNQFYLYDTYNNGYNGYNYHSNRTYSENPIISITNYHENVKCISCNTWETYEEWFDHMLRCKSCKRPI
jgi:hypothetical protein